MITTEMGLERASGMVMVCLARSAQAVIGPGQEHGEPLAEAGFRSYRALTPSSISGLYF